jgi:hypothetical protein
MMTAFLITIFILHILGVGGYLSEISTKTYPYTQKKTYGGAWFSLLVTLVFAVWAGVLLFN